MQLTLPTTKRLLRRFLGMINYYCNIWRCRSHILAPLTAMCSAKAKFVWHDKRQKAFEDIKAIIGRKTLLAYPDFWRTSTFIQTPVITNLEQSLCKMTAHWHSTAGSLTALKNGSQLRGKNCYPLSKHLGFQNYTIGSKTDSTYKSQESPI
jgi:hypothetical protein